jgi:Rrf2 family protein
MVDVALHQAAGPVTRREISQRQGISAPYLAQLFAKLSKAGLVQSIRGPGGGYILARSPEDIRAGDIIRAAEEPLVPVSCVADSLESHCPRVEECATHVLWTRLAQQIEAVLDGVNLEELRSEALELARSITPAEQCLV